MRTPAPSGAIGAIVLFPFLFAAAALGQSRQPPAPTFRSDTRLVQVTVVVHDKQGKPVTGLTAGDFHLFEEGKEQPIQLFSVETDRIAPRPAAAPLSASTFSNRFEGRAPASVTVILLDRLNTGFTDQKQARDHIVSFLGQVQRDDRVALYVLESGFIHILHDFTTDSTALLRALARYRATTSSAQLAAAEAQTPDFAQTGNAAEDAAMDAFLRQSTEMIAADANVRRAESTLSGLEAIANHLAGIRGRKNLIWVSSGFPVVISDERGQARTMTKEVNRATRAVNNANVAIYPVDARGLIGAFASPPGARSPVFTTMSTVRGNTDVMQTLAADTGGRAFFNTNDISGAVRRAIDDGRVTYVLGYYPSHGNWDGKFREIKVKVNRPGVDVRHRRGYLALPAAVDAAKRKEALLDALRSPLEATGIGLTAHVASIATQGQAADEVAIAIHVDPGSLTLEKTGAVWEGAFDLLIAQSTSAAAFFKDLDTTVKLELPSEKHDQMLAEGFTVNRKVVLRADTHRLLIVLRDVASGAIGSVIIPAEKMHAALR